MEYSSKDRKFAWAFWNGGRWVNSDQVESAPTAGGPVVETLFAAALAREYKEEMEAIRQARLKKRWKTRLYFYRKRRDRELKQWHMHNPWFQKRPRSFTIVG